MTKQRMIPSFRRPSVSLSKLNYMKAKKILLITLVAIVVLAAVTGGAVADRLFGFKPLDKFFPRSLGQIINQKLVNEESMVIDVAEKVSPSVVTVSIQTPKRRILQFSPFGGFSTQIQGGEPQDIGSGFIVSADGLIITNKHVVSATGATYKVITKDNREYPVVKISRDPANDVAILKFDPPAGGLNPVELGDSAKLKVGQFVIAIGTALGEFRHTVTTGVISGLGRGITAGSAYEGYVEKLDDIIQTDAAINPGNSGGPLLNSAGQVIGVNVAVAQGASNIGFALPINVVKDSLNQFKSSGFAKKAYLGVQYQEAPQGAYVVEVIAGSPAQKAGLKAGDIIINAGDDLAKLVSGKKPGDKLDLEVYRDGETLKLSATLSEAGQ
ncbi:hypothetical protein COT08_01270 [Candidatus Woesebacteria bacterium CG07_land_8_20_14_0_80_44_9]|uniref:PDZ domain-containing protein n=3 Tax=Candidatus Woeseibacteriota TaxID=1752722 RepID=A0A2H0BHW5_9BACT|nr:MAG: hypothetical protein COX04_00480 [Candidatus Woesebacteria bacterium CG22_combo_CG10-13_8_21_14_all_45_10]PIU28458.1 MAG: hypothetical protein COT08_01270 [Candidatus Woesebacteria bacterium CG07_land_8_20_14_0_80_44_9]PIZ45642.1 MAG: hypothetical protein COY30_01645 [Candidatus Woesebacteria bacterium CG_4_10_14_0_2_um_filter_44_9]